MKHLWEKKTPRQSVKVDGNGGSKRGTFPFQQRNGGRHRGKGALKKRDENCGGSRKKISLQNSRNEVREVQIGSKRFLAFSRRS